jgi:ATP-binding cassette subfamily B protein
MGMPDKSTELLHRPYRFYVKRHWLLVALGTLWLFLTNLMDSLIPTLIGMTIDKITTDKPLNDVGQSVAMIFGVVVLMSAFRFLWRFFWATFHHTVAEDLRDRLFERIVGLGPSFFRARKIGQLISLISNDVNSFRMGIGPGLLVLLDGVFLTMLNLPLMLAISPAWTWQTLALMPLVPFLVHWILNKLHVEYHARQTRFSDFSASAQEIISGVRVIKSFAQEHNQTVQFNKHSGAFRAACDRVSFWDALFGPSLELPMALGCVLLLVLGTGHVVSGEVTLGQFIAFYQYIQRMVWPMSAIGIGLGHIQEGRASFRRIREVLEFEPDVPDTGEAEISEIVSLEVRDLSFTYPGARQPSLENISFYLKRGGCLGVTGMTGSGKSTLMEILSRQFAVPSGTVLINGVSIEKIKNSSLRKLIGVVPQEAFLFSRKVGENVALGLDDWDLDDVRGAAQGVHLDQEIESWPGAYDALVGERGVNLSGGQKQRMTLARAAICGFPLVILDDSLSAVDAKTEVSILSRLQNELKKTTSIVVSHRLASIRGADQILVLAGGRMEALGKHDELLKSSETYQTLHRMQNDGVNV